MGNKQWMIIKYFNQSKQELKTCKAILNFLNCLLLIVLHLPIGYCSSFCQLPIANSSSLAYC
jgi:hypothetical protein